MEDKNDWIVVEDPAVIYNSEKYPHSEITYHIINSCFEVYNFLGRGFSEIVYKESAGIRIQKKELII